MPPSDPATIIPPTAHNAAPGGAGATFCPAPAPGGAPAARQGRLGRRTGIVSAPPDPRRRAAALTRRYSLLDKAGQLLPHHRVSWCARHPLDDQVSVLYHPEHASASYGGLAVCGSVWVCPLCGAKIIGRRAADLAAGATSWRRRGGQIVMLTLTLRHQRGHELRHLLRAMNSAYRRIRQGRIFQTFKKHYGLRGTVTAREITHGKNGWHPHIHALLFVAKPLSDSELAQMRREIYDLWVRALQRSGLNATFEHGVRVTNTNDAAADYVTKVSATWSISQEMVNALKKEGRQGNCTPAQLLALAVAGDGQAGRLYVEYADATRGLNMIVWSPGLRAELLDGDENEHSDQELAEESMSDAIEMFVITPQQWQMILRYGIRGDLLAEVCYADADNITQYLAGWGINLGAWQLRYTIRDRNEQKS